jgi:hypothetical protein
MKYTLIVIFLLLSTFGHSQNEEYDNVDSGDDLIISQKDLKDRFYLSLTNSYFVDFINSPLETGYRIFSDIASDDVTTITRRDPIAVKSGYQSFLSIGIEPRLNLKEIKDNLAIAISAPVALGFGNAFPVNNARGSTGFGHVQVPILVKLYSGAGSTFDADDDFGISLGGGLELNKIGLFDFQNQGQGSEEVPNNAWVMPAVSLGVHFYRGYNPMEVNLKYGFGPIETQRIDGFGNVLFPEINSRASSVKLSLIYLMGS